MEITNKHHTEIILPDGTALTPNETKDVANPGLLKKNSVIKAWLAAGILTSDESSDTPQGEDDKAALISQLAEAGIEVDKRWGIAKLKELLADATNPPQE